MPSLVELYNQEVLEGHREALAALRELLTQETDPDKRRKLANAILRARPVKREQTDDPTPPPAPRPTAKANRNDAIDRENALEIDDALDIDDERGPDEALDHKADELRHRLANGPDRQGALRELQAFMLECASTILPPRSTDESS